MGHLWVVVGTLEGVKFSEPKDPLEVEADRLLADDTKKRGSGLTVRSPRPRNEHLTDEFVGVCGASTVDEYPSDEGVDCEMSVRDVAANQMLRVLTVKQRDCVELVVMRGWSLAQAADELGISSATVHSHVQSGIKRLKAHYEKSPVLQALFPEGAD